MSAELPVITSNIGVVEDIIDDGVDGIIYESKNIKELVKKIEFLIENPDIRIDIAQNARKIEEKFTITHAVNKLRKIL